MSQKYSQLYKVKIIYMYMYVLIFFSKIQLHKYDKTDIIEIQISPQEK